jgi:hypothetical protein
MDASAQIHLVVVRGDGEPGNPLERAARTISLPGALVQVVTRAEDIAPGSAASGKTAREGRPTAYLCMDRSCTEPLTDASALRQAVRAFRRQGRTHG